MELNLYELFRALLEDLDVDRYTASYILRRLSNEGVKFVTVTLPSFSKHVLSCIEAGEWTYWSTAVRCNRGLPKIFRGYLEMLFHYDESSKKWLVRQDADPVSLWAIRQACEYTYKLALPFGDEVLASYSEKFEADDASVFANGDYDERFVDEMRRNLETYYPGVCGIRETDVASEARPGPGTFSGAGSYPGWYRRNYRAATIPREASGLAFGLRFNRRAPNPTIDDGDPSYSEVLFVPKDSRGPRVIVREPYNKLLFQMGYNSCLSKALERDTHYRVNFSDQSVNRRLAHLSSTTRSYATLDLKDASDRVSYAIVRAIFRYLPIGKLLRFRTPRASLPSGRIITLRKLAGMGSGYTFPTMALIIHLAICTRVSRRFGIGYRSAMSMCYVYGDDIIIPTHWYEAAVQALSWVGLSVNLSKSYRNSFFRESCGGDYFFGNDVTPARLRLQNAGCHTSGVSLKFDNREFALLGIERHARELHKLQLHSAQSYLNRFLEQHLGPLPLVSGDSPFLGRYTDRESLLRTLSTDEYGNYLRVKAWAVEPKTTSMRDMCPYRYLTRALSKNADDPWLGRLYPGGNMSSFGEISIPRRIKLRRRKVSSFAFG